MSTRVRKGAGIHMSTFKEKGDAAESVPDSPEDPDINYSGVTPTPEMMAEWRKAV